MGSALAEAPRIRICLPQRRKDAKFGEERLKLGRMIFISVLRHCGLGALAGDIPSVGVGFGSAALFRL